MNSGHLRTQAVLLLLCSGLAAQGQLPTHKPSITEVDYTIGSGDFQRVEFLLPPHLPSHQRDAIVLRGGALGRVHGIGTFNAVEELSFPVAVTDIARIPGGNPTTPAHDAILFGHVGSDTIGRIHWDDVETQHIVMFPMVGWQAISELTVASTASGYEISAIAQDRQTLLRGSVDATGIAPVSAHWVGSTIRATALGDEDGDGQLETFALTDSGVVVVNRDGTWRSNLPWPHDDGTLTRAGSKIYWLRRNLQDTRWELTVVAGADPIAQPPDIVLPGGDFTLSSMVETDVDQDGEPDLLVGQSSTLQSIQVRVTDASPGVLDVEQYYVALAAQLPLLGGSTGPVAGADVDGDGYHDVVAAMDNGDKLVIVRGTSHGRTYASAVGDLPPLLHSGSVFANSLQSFPGLHLHFAHSSLFDLSNANYTHVQVNVWVEPAAGEEIPTESAINRIYEIEPWSGPGSPTAHSIYIDTGTVPHSADAFWHAEVVFGNGDATEPGDGLIFTVAGFSATTNASQTYLDMANDHLEELYPNIGPVSPVWLSKNGGSSPPKAGRERTGGYRPTGGVLPPIVKPTRTGSSTGSTQPIQTPPQ